MPPVCGLIIGFRKNGNNGLSDSTAEISLVQLSNYGVMLCQRDVVHLL